MVSFAFTAAGVVIEETSPAGRARKTLPGGTYPQGLHAVLHGLAGGSGRAMVEVGLGIMVCTPIAAVAAAVNVWRHEGDRKMAWVGTAVLAVLGLSCTLALIGA
jgi:uncharacterized membrane protein